MDLSVNNIVKVLEKKGYDVFMNTEKNYNLNIIGIRTLDTDANKFNDFRVIFWNYKGALTYKLHSLTTDPGLFYRENPENPFGTAILKEGQYKGCWKQGWHKGYTALVQAKPVTVIRDFDKDVHLKIYTESELSIYTKKELKDKYDTVEWYDGDKLIYREQTGFFGINHHRAGENSQYVNNWSAGCQVTAKSAQHEDYMSLCKNAANIWGDSFTYTLLNERDFDV